MGYLSKIPDIAYCKSCVHYRSLYHDGKKDTPKACHYILDTGFALMA